MSKAASARLKEVEQQLEEVRSAGSKRVQALELKLKVGSAGAVRSAEFMRVNGGGGGGMAVGAGGIEGAAWAFSTAEGAVWLLLHDDAMDCPCCRPAFHCPSVQAAEARAAHASLAQDAHKPAPRPPRTAPAASTAAANSADAGGPQREAQRVRKLERDLAQQDAELASLQKRAAAADCG